MNLPKRLEELVHDISSIRAGKTFAPSHYIDPTLTAIEQDILEKVIGEDVLMKDGSPVNHTMQKYRTELRTKLHEYIRGELTKGDN